jgi:hypothetical protein
MISDITIGMVINGWTWDGLLGRKLNNYLLDKYSVEEYLEGIDRLCQYYNNYHNQPKEELIVKKSWMSNKHRVKFFI